MAWGGAKDGNGGFSLPGVIQSLYPIIYLFLRIFILEGILTVSVSLIAYFIVPTWSHKAKFVRFRPDDRATRLH